jgi:hypothetical protein
VILCLGRTGSTHLQSMLDHHSQARCHSELFGDGKPPTFATSAHTDPLAFVDEMLASAGERALGFKLPLSSIRAHPDVARVLGADPRPAVIRLSRDNRLAQLVSRRLMAETGVSQSIFGAYGDATVEIGPGTCLAALDAIERDEGELDRLAGGAETFRIAYEELGDDERLVALQRFLGLDPEPLRSWFTKLRRRPLAETVSNWDQLAAALRGSPYERFLEEES